MGSTRNDVARRAGVSAATVSRVYNHPDMVAREKREAVCRAAEELNYKPNRYASLLRQGRPGTIHFVEHRRPPQSTWAHYRGYNWFYGDIIRGIQDALTDTSYGLQLTTLSSWEEMIPLAEGKQCAGIIAFDIEDPREARQIQNLGLPYVLGHHGSDLQEFPRSATSNFEGGRLQGEALLKTGHRRPLYITDRPGTVPVHRRRLEGFLSTWPREMEPPGVIDIQEGDSRQRILQQTSSEIFDSLVFVNDFTAVDVLRFLFSETSLQVPRDLSAVGYDNLPVSRAFPFDLATVELNLGEIYRHAALLLVQHLQNRGREKGVPTPLTGESHHTILPRFIPGTSLLDRGQGH